MQIVVFSGHAPSPPFEDLYIKSFHLWKSQWEEAYRTNFKSEKTHFADDFVRQDWWIAIVIDGEPVGLVSQRRFDFANPIASYDSWFRFFKKKDLKKFIQERASNCIVTSNLLVSKDHRKYKYEIHLSEILVQLSMLNALELGFSYKFGCSNNSRSVDKLCKTTGAITLSSEIETVEGTKLDTFYWTKESITGSLENYSPIVFQLFEERIDTLITPKQRIEDNVFTLKIG